VVVDKVTTAEEVATVTEVEVETGAAVDEAATGGRDKETPACAQRPSAAAMVFCKSAAEQAAWTHGVKAVMKAVALQIHATSVSAHPVLPKLVMAHVTAHVGSALS